MLKILGLGLQRYGFEYQLGQRVGIPTSARGLSTTVTGLGSGLIPVSNLASTFILIVEQFYFFFFFNVLCSYL